MHVAVYFVLCVRVYFVVHFVYFLCVLTNFEVRLVSEGRRKRERALRAIEGESFWQS